MTLGTLLSLLDSTYQTDLLYDELALVPIASAPPLGIDQ